MDKRYDPTPVEGCIYKFWEDGGHFQPNPNAKPYTIVIPPPNVTGQLHMGHALDETLQDILIRMKRMQGYSALWLPGTDHAGIATQIRVEAELREKEGKTRHDLGREEFLKRVWDWKKTYGSRITSQLRRLGSSCDWSRERFTMDEDYSRAVRKVFVTLYEKGIIYKGERIINWCPCCVTALSDSEVEHEENAGNLWHIKYGELTVATTRPETMLGDTAVAVHPDDERYKHLIGKKIPLPLCNCEILVVADDYADMEFGTGAVKITPAHDPNDFELGKRHNLEIIRVIDDNGRINDLGGKYARLDRYEARKAIVADLESAGLLVKIESRTNNVGKCYRCSTVVEPIVSNQWFVDMKKLAVPAIDIVKKDEIQFVPPRFAKTYLNWMENVHDWCVSRQLWWGHRIPAFYCDTCGNVTVTEADDAPKCCGTSMRQDDDVLDTWFSSALWPFATLGWPDNTEDLKHFYPTATLVTGYDIIFFWVARMIFSGLEFMEEKPFSHVFIHGLVRDDKGRKMSKSAGNGIDPLEIIDQYGADALRMTLATGNTPGNDMRFYVERVEANRNFANKLWNATRFVLMNLPENMEDVTTLPSNLTAEDKWIISKYNRAVSEVTENLEKFELGIAGQKIYDFIWDEFCDWYIEMVKPRLFEQSDEIAPQVLVYVLSNTLKLLHPFMPFITEEIIKYLPTGLPCLITAKWPEYDESLNFDGSDIELIKEMLRKVRNLRAEMNVPPSQKARLIIITDNPKAFEDKIPLIQRLGSASEIQLGGEVPENAVSVVVDGAEIFMPLSDLIDTEKERTRLTKERDSVQQELKRAQGKLKNEGFLAKAPKDLIQQEREKVEKFTLILEKIEGQLNEL